MSRKIPSGNGRKKPRSLPSNPRKKPVPGRHKVRRPGVEIPEVEVVKGIVLEKRIPSVFESSGQRAV